MLKSHKLALAGTHAGALSEVATSPLPAATPPSTSTRKHAIFEESMIPKSSSHGWQRAEETFISLGFHFLILVALVLAPLYYTQSLDLRQFQATYLISPSVPPPPPPPAAPRLVRSVPRTFFTRSGLMAPSSIPRTIAMIHEKASDIPPEDFTDGVVGGVPGGMPGGSIGGALGGILGGMPNTAVAVAPPPIAAPKKPLRIGGNVKPPRQIFAPHLDFPILAKQAHVQGRVVIDAIIDDHGNVVELHVVSGPPLLVPAALQNVSQWKYEPTYLNGQPIAVEMVVNVDFKLGQ